MVEQLRGIFLTRLNLDVRDPDVDLLSTGLVDSLGIVTLLLAIEEEYGFEVPIDTFELEDFQTLTRIAEVVLRRAAQDPLPSRE